MPTVLIAIISTPSIIITLLETASSISLCEALHQTSTGLIEDLIHLISLIVLVQAQFSAALDTHSQ